MPEIFSRKIDSGFICIWEVSEPAGFFEQAVGKELLENLSKQHSQHRLLQKLVPHFILGRHHPHIKINNLERKPVASQGFVSISHCNNLLGLYYHPNQAVGIDIEHEHPKVLRIRKKFLNPQELAFCGDDITRCLVIWAAKESIFKKYGNETAFFANNIAVEPFESQSSFALQARVSVNGTCISQRLWCELNEELVIVFTL